MGWAIGCYAVSLLVGLPVLGDLLPAVLLTSLRTASLAAAFVLVGLPQVVEAACIAAAGIVDTHVLMALAAFGTLYMGMAQEVRGACVAGCCVCMVEPRGRRRVRSSLWRATPARLMCTCCRARCCSSCSSCRTRWRRSSRSAREAAWRASLPACRSRCAPRCWGAPGRAWRAPFCAPCVLACAVVLQAVQVEVDAETGGPVLASARSVAVRSVPLGSHVLVKAGEEVRQR